MIKLNQAKNAAAAIVQAVRDGDEKAQEAAFSGFMDAVAADVAAQFEAAQASNDTRALADRGFRQLTGEETAYYQKVIEALKSSNPKQAFDAIPDDAMPTTIFEDVMRDLEQERPLLAAVKPVYTKYLTEWVLNDHTAQRFAWGEITDAITKEITSAFKVVSVKQSKLSAFAVVSRGMLDLGPVFLDGYVRACLFEAWGDGMEYGIVAGTGINSEPIGLRKDIHEGVSIDTSTGYPDKTAVPVTDFLPASYGPLVASLAVNEKGNPKRGSGNLCLLTNANTYLTKVMPAIRMLTSSGEYSDAFPVATKPIETEALADNEGILARLDEYGLFVGGDRGIESSDEVKFIEDQRAFKLVTYANGRAVDNTSAILLDLTNLPALAFPVQGSVTTTAQG
uniref:Major capsid protein a n=1 Tax=uncultured bacterium Contig1770 TaxID=1393510 RepID=W0FNA9_9BACT|nr:major capsid protein a [uncultured bacterium Contig1770]